MSRKAEPKVTQAAAVRGIGKIVVGASAEYVKEEEDVRVRSFATKSLGVKLSREQQNEIVGFLGKREKRFTDILVKLA